MPEPNKETIKAILLNRTRGKLNGQDGCIKVYDFDALTEDLHQYFQGLILKQGWRSRDRQGHNED